MASFAAAHGCGPAPVRREIRVGTGWRLHTLVLQRKRGHVEDVDSAGSNPAERTTPFGSASTRPWYGRAARLDTGEGLQVTVVSAVSI